MKAFLAGEQVKRGNLVLSHVSTKSSCGLLAPGLSIQELFKFIPVGGYTARAHQPDTVDLQATPLVLSESRLLLRPGTKFRPWSLWSKRNEFLTTFLVPGASSCIQNIRK